MGIKSETDTLLPFSKAVNGADEESRPEVVPNNDDYDDYNSDDFPFMSPYDSSIGLHSTPRTPQPSHFFVTPELHRYACLILGGTTTGILAEMIVRSTPNVLLVTEATPTEGGGDRCREEGTGSVQCTLKFCVDRLCVAFTYAFNMLTTMLAFSIMGCLAVGCTAMYYGCGFTEESVFGFQIGALVLLSLSVPLFVSVSLGCLVSLWLPMTSHGFCLRCFAHVLLAAAGLLVFPGMDISIGLTLAHYYANNSYDEARKTMLPWEAVFWSCVLANLFQIMFGLLLLCMWSVEVPTTADVRRSSSLRGRFLLPSTLAGSCVANIYGYGYVAGAIVGVFGLAPAVIPILYKLRP